MNRLCSDTRSPITFCAKTDMIISYHQRSLLVNRHNVGVAVHRLVLARGLQNEAIVPLVRLEIGSKSLLAGRRSIGIRAEAIMTIFNALVSYEDGGTASLRLCQFGSDFLVELEIKSSYQNKPRILWLPECSGEEKRLRWA